MSEPQYAAQGTKRRVKAQADAPVIEVGDHLSMETAPKDGTKIVLRFADGEELEARWRPTRFFDRSVMRYVPTGYWILGDNQAARIVNEPVGWRR